MVKKYLSNGAILFVSRFDGIILGYHLVHTERVIDDSWGIQKELSSHQIYQFDGIVAPEYRSKGIGQVHMQKYQEYFFQKGYLESLCLVEKDNVTSLKFHTRNEYQIIQKGILTSIFGRQKWRWIEGLE